MAVMIDIAKGSLKIGQWDEYAFVLDTGNVQVKVD